MTGKPYFRDGAQIIDSTIKDFVRIENGATVIGVTLEKYMRVGAGVWRRQPRYLHIETEDVELGVTESVDGCAFIRCQHKPMVKWLKKRSLWQRAAGWSDDVANKIVRTFEQWLDEPISI